MKEIILDKLNLINLSVLALSFSEMEQTLKIVLLVSSIFYTILKIYDHQKCKNEKKVD